MTSSESLPRPRRPLPTQQQPPSSQKLGRIREDEGAVVSSVVKEPPEATATPEPLSDEDLPLDPDLYQDLCAGAFDDHGLVSRQSIPWWKGGGYGSRVSVMKREEAEGMEG